MSTATAEKTRRETGAEKMDRKLDEITADVGLSSWNDFVEALQVPSDLFPALLANRPQLIKLVTPRSLSADEHRVYLDLISGLMATNDALRQHAAHVSHAADMVEQHLSGTIKSARRLSRFAEFKTSGEDGDE